MLVRHAIEEADQADWAATKIQSLYRGRAGRAEFMRRAEAHVDELERVHLREQSACVALQAHCRRSAAPVSYTHLRAHET